MCEKKCGSSPVFCHPGPQLVLVSMSGWYRLSWMPLPSLTTPPNVIGMGVFMHMARLFSLTILANVIGIKRFASRLANIEQSE
jgi:hypothetical protein